MVAPLPIEVVEEAFAMGEHGGVVVMVWRGHATRSQIERSVEGFDAIARRVPGRLSMLAVFEERSSPPDFADLAFSARAFDRFADVLLATAGVIEARVMPSMIVDAAGWLHALRRRPTQTKFCADVREATVWLATRHPHAEAEATFRDALVSAVEQVRAALIE